MWKKTTHYFLLILLLTCITSGFLFSTSVLTKSNIKNVDDNSINVNDLRSSDPDITIITPENKSYSHPMSGYYPATYGFENDEVGSVANEWNDSNSDPHVDTEVVVEKTNHFNVIRFNDNQGSEKARIWNKFQNQEFGTIEFWYLPEDATTGFQISLHQDNTSVYNRRIGLIVEYEKWYYSDEVTEYEVPNVPNLQDNVWQHVRIEFECTNGGYQGLNHYKFNLIINGISSGELPFYYDGPSIGFFYLATGAAGITDSWIDAVGYSWDPDYAIGDNKYEGLLLNFDTSFSPDWLEYSLDDQPNKTILGNTVIPYPSAEGIYSIQVFGNNSIGTMFESDVRYFTIGSSPTIPLGLPIELVIIIIVLASVGGAVLVFVTYFVYNKSKTRLPLSERKPTKVKIKKQRPSVESPIFSCPFCEAELPGGQKFCVYCGAKLEE